MKPTRRQRANAAAPTRDTDTTPIRADLVDVAPMYYPIIEQSRHSNIKALCEAIGAREKVIHDAVSLARINCSDFAIVEGLSMGPAEAQIRAVLMLGEDGSIILCCGVFSAMSSDRAAVDQIAAEFGAAPEFTGKLVFVGEFRAGKRKAQ